MDTQKSLGDFGMLFFRNTDVKEGDKVQITSSPMNETTKWGTTRTTFYVLHNGAAKKMSLAGHQIRELVGLLGTNPIGWIGKQVSVRTEPYTKANGEKLLTLRFSA